MVSGNPHEACWLSASHLSRHLVASGHLFGSAPPHYPLYLPLSFFNPETLKYVPAYIPSFIFSRPQLPEHLHTTSTPYAELHWDPKGGDHSPQRARH